MLFVEDNVIYLTKGDDGVLPVDVSSGDEAYVMGEQDMLTLTVRMQPSAEFPVLLEVKSTPGSNRIIFNAADTKDLEPGEYSADIQLTDGNGKVCTVWPDWSAVAASKRYRVKNIENFVIMPEVTV